MEASIYRLFSINLINLIHSKVMLSKHYHIAPSEIDKMPWWEYEFFLKEINNDIKDEEKRNKDEEERYRIGDIKRQASGMVPKAPKMPSMPSIPKF